MEIDISIEELAKICTMLNSYLLSHPGNSSQEATDKAILGKLVDTHKNAYNSATEEQNMYLASGDSLEKIIADTLESKGISRHETNHNITAYSQDGKKMVIILDRGISDKTYYVLKFYVSEKDGKPWYDLAFIEMIPTDAIDAMQCAHFWI